MSSTDTFLPEAIRLQSAALLSHPLAACLGLYSLLKQAHGTLRGPGFIAINMPLDMVADRIGRINDALAERLGARTAHDLVLPVAIIPGPARAPGADNAANPVAVALTLFGQSTFDAITLANSYGDGETARILEDISAIIEAQLRFVMTDIVSDGE